MLTADQILGASDIIARTVDVPEWGGPVRVRMMTSAARDRFEAEMAARKGDMGNFRARLAVRCICDEQGKLLFRDDQAEALGEKSAAAINRVFVVATELNHFSDAEVEAIEKN